jgi:Ni/Co efflux regulator RcnB
MKQLVSLVVLAAAFAAPFAHAQQPDAVRTAVDAADRWLVPADAGDGAATWDQAASAFQAAVSKADWSTALRQVRQPLGAVTSRKMVSSEYKRSLPGAPDGEYVVIQYDTQFAHKAHAVETVVPMRERDGSWKVSGYFVK